MGYVPYRKDKGVGMKRRGVLLLTSIVVMVVVAAGVALAANITCDGGGCLGTNAADTITGSNSGDVITAASGADIVNARGGNDTVYGDNNGDTLNGGANSDYIEGGRGDNVARGNEGDGDVVNVVDGDGNDFASGGDGGGAPGTADDDVCIIDNFPGSASVFGGTTADDWSVSCETVYEAD